MGNKKRAAFSIVEMIIVVVIMGALAGFAIPNYMKPLRKARYNNARQQLISIYGAQSIHKARSGIYWPTDGSDKDTDEINTGLNLNLIENDTVYSCSGTADATTFSCDATIGNGTCWLTLTQAALSATNPADGGTCP